MAGFNNDYFSTLVGYNVGNLKQYDVQDFLCFKEQQFQAFHSDNVHKTYPQCLQGCFETTYNVFISYRKLISNEVKSVVNTDYMKDKDIEKNYLLLRLSFDSMTVLTVTERQSFAIKDLFVYFGSMLTLFVGISFVGAAYVGHFTAHICASLWNFVWNGVKKRTTKTRVVQ